MGLGGDIQERGSPDAYVNIISLTWNTPSSLTHEMQVVSFPLSLTANAAQELVQTFHTNNSGEEFGEIEVTLEYIVDLRPKVVLNPFSKNMCKQAMNCRAFFYPVYELRPMYCLN